MFLLIDYYASAAEDLHTKAGLYSYEDSCEKKILGITVETALERESYLSKPPFDVVKAHHYISDMRKDGLMATYGIIKKGDEILQVVNSRVKKLLQNTLGNEIAVIIFMIL
ncbi:unnamed protein product [Protopolystoma xenopodis]|uniref:PDZ domain-containing protein n=1 Tax=Protopolystoma xenopodis TaxID=117903 RepID=A0A3S5CRJ3_9PLAT|nr:unnamed protein product [Protopolystoma xenopodis]